MNHIVHVTSWQCELSRMMRTARTEPIARTLLAKYNRLASNAERLAYCDNATADGAAAKLRRFEAKLAKVLPAIDAIA